MKLLYSLTSLVSVGFTLLSYQQMTYTGWWFPAFVAGCFLTVGSLLVLGLAVFALKQDGYGYKLDQDSLYGRLFLSFLIYDSRLTLKTSPLGLWMKATISLLCWILGLAIFAVFMWILYMNPIQTMSFIGWILLGVVSVVLVVAVSVVVAAFIPHSIIPNIDWSKLNPTIKLEE